MSAAAQRRKQGTTQSHRVSRHSTRTSRIAYATRAALTRRQATAPPTETIIVMDNTEDSEEVVDLTCDGLELVDEGRQSQRTSRTESCYVVSSDVNDDDDDDAPVVLSEAALSTLRENSRTRVTPGTVSCPVCMDTYTEIVDSGRLVVSTKCGHIFCSKCLRDALRQSHTCPMCRKTLTHRQYHPIYL
ncbi:E3 ubiquitin-protein ligase RNF4 [Thalassophryne amazonica]|uniref:E3 ubiquitin-protein ligase RNF4 n=1 Tax=Thalassophryne amazonica TaxID=390379 RepID=UPI00147086C1|nr:E3 ubiquitin-protein ligase RNF4 [Thalassophryne amazonica]